MLPSACVLGTGAVGASVNAMHLLKITYIALGYVLAIWARSLLDEALETWCDEPAARNFYRARRALDVDPLLDAIPDSPPGYAFTEDALATMRRMAGMNAGDSVTNLSSAMRRPGTPWTLT